MTAAQLKFAAGVAAGLTDSDAYAKAYPNSKHPRQDAARLLSDKTPTSSKSNTDERYNLICF